MFRILLVHPQQALNKRHLVYWNIQIAICVAPPEDKQVMLETCRSP
jgi:hypothetical protein